MKLSMLLQLIVLKLIPILLHMIEIQKRESY